MSTTTYTMRGTTPATRMRRLPRLLLSAGIVFATCFVYYVEFLWWQQQQHEDPSSALAGRSRRFGGDRRGGGGGAEAAKGWEDSRRDGGAGGSGSHSRVRSHNKVVAGGPTPDAMVTSAVEQSLSDFAADSAGASGRGTSSKKKTRRQQQQQDQAAAAAAVSIRGDNEQLAAAVDVGLVDDGADLQPPPAEQEQHDKEEEEVVADAEEEVDEDEDLRKGKALAISDLDEETMERKRLAQNFTRYPLPRIRTVLDANRTSLIGDPQPYLDFAIIGFGKCGTTSAMHLLRSHSQLQSLQSELWALFNGDVPKLVNRIHDKLYLALPRGYKCPGDIFSPNSLNLFRDKFPKTKLIVGVRHPVPWFQSLYNFRIQNFDSYESMPMPNNMIGLCNRQMLMCCTQRGHFGHFLMKLGKQQFLWQQGQHPDQPDNESTYRVVPNTLEYNLSHWYDPYGDKRWAYERWDKNMYENPVPNPVFLFELNQMGDANSSRTQEFQRDLAEFLDVSPEGFHPTPERVSPGKIWDDETQQKRNARKINICDDIHKPARNELMAQSRATSLWIRNVFLKSPGVYSSSTNDYLEELFEKWMHDPCDDVKKKAATTTG